MLFKRRGHSGLSIRTVCTDRKRSFRSYTIGKLHLILLFNHVLFERRSHNGLSIRMVCTDRKRSFRSVYDPSNASHQVFEARENINHHSHCPNKQNRHACLPRSLSVSDSMTRLERKKLSIDGRYLHNKQARYTCIPCSSSVSDNMTRLERKKLSIDGYLHNKQTRYTCIPRSLSVSDNMTRLEGKKLSIDGYLRN